MGLARTQIKTPASERSESTFGNGQIISAAIRGQPGSAGWMANRGP